FFLPTFIYLAASHSGAGAFKIFCFQVPNQQSVRTQEQGVVVPSCLAQGRQHLRPHAAVAGFVFVQPFGFNLKYETNALHALPSSLVKAPKQQAALFRQHPHRKNASVSPPSTGITCPLVLELCSPASQM